MLKRRQTERKHLPYQELLDQLGRPGCAVCHLADGAVARYFESLCGEFVTDPESRFRWRDSFGLCGPHSHQFEKLAPRLTVAILYEDLLRRMDAELVEGKGRSRAALPCPACAAATQAEESGLRVLAESAGEPELGDAFRASSGLCRRHVLALCARLRGPARERLIGEERARVETLLAELREVQRKHDYRYSREPWGEEKTAPTRAVRKIAGEPPDR